MTANPQGGFDATAPHDRLLPWRAVKEMTGISRTTAWRLQNTGDFPRPVVISPGRVGWRETDVSAWKAALAPRGGPASPPRPKPPERVRGAARAEGPPAAVEPLPRPPTEPVGARPRPRRTSPVAANQMSFDF